MDHNYRIYFDGGYCYYYTEPVCCIANRSIEGKIPISAIIESTDKPIVTFDVPFTAEKDVGSYECSSCRRKNKCICAKLGYEGDNRHMIITFGFEFEQSDYDKLSTAAFLACKEKELQERERKLQGREQDIISKESKENTIMANNIFNMNMEFGPNKDENIASTLMGMAVKNGDSWRIYDKKKRKSMMLAICSSAIFLSLFCPLPSLVKAILSRKMGSTIL